MDSYDEGSTMLPFLGFPGGLELIVILLIVVVLFGIPVAIVVLGVILLRSSRGDGDIEDEVAALREEVAELRASMETEEGSGDEADEMTDETAGE